MFETRGILFVVLDISCLILVGLPFAILTPQHNPFKRGFFCNDDSIKYPLKEDTISYQLLGGIMIPFTVLSVVFGECLLVYLKRIKSKSSIRNSYVAYVYKAIGTYLFGAAMNQSLTDIAKYSIGRLRPHFLDVCKPVWETINCKSGDYIENFTCTGDSTMVNEASCKAFTNQSLSNQSFLDVCKPVWEQIHCKSGDYIENFTCTGDSTMVNEARLSFYSGHSSFSMYCMLFLVLYIQARLVAEWARLLRPTIQFFLISAALYVGLSRVSDYKHHWSDVLAGLIQGFIIAILTVVCVSDFFKKPVVPQKEEEDDDMQHSTLQESPTNGNHYGSTH